MTEETHALLSASASQRWLNCTASVLACKDLLDNAGEAAQKGTEVHELCAYKVLTKVLGKEAKRPDHSYNKIDGKRLIILTIQHLIRSALVTAT